MRSAEKVVPVRALPLLVVEFKVLSVAPIQPVAEPGEVADLSVLNCQVINCDFFRTCASLPIYICL